MFGKMTGIAAVVTLLAASVPVFASEGTSNGIPSVQNFHYTHLPGADQSIDGTTGILGGSAYLFVAGSAFTPRTSAQTVTYPGGGCVHSNLAVTTSLELPDSATIEGVRVFYYNTNPSAGIGLFLTNYTGVGGSFDLLTGTTTSGAGYNSEYFAAGAAQIVDNFAGSYVLTATMAADTRFCGMRVFYTP